MAKFRKKPVIVEAWQWLYSPEQAKDPAWVRDRLNGWPQIGGIAFEPDHVDGPRICIATLEGLVVAHPGDWLVKGIQGELYPVKPDIFEATYDLLDEAIEA